MTDPIKVSFHAFWGRFFEDEQNNISFFIDLFSKVKRPIQIIKDAEESDIIVNSLYAPQVKMHGKIHILFAPEPNYDKTSCELLLGGVDEQLYPNAINVPLFVSYLFCGNFLPRCISRPPVITVPQKFCCWIVSNPKCAERNTIFHILNSYKRVDSVGHAFNTTGYLLSEPWGSKGFFDFISQYKFVICGENTKIDQYVTEKIFHGYLGRSIPIYWGSDYVKTVFDPNSYISLDEANQEGFEAMFRKVVEVDLDDQKWLSMANAPVFLNNTLKGELTMSSLQERVADRIELLLSKRE
jgi:hypothetical protein